MTFSELRQRVIIIHGLVEKTMKDCEVLCIEYNNEPNIDKKDILKTSICELGNRLHKYKGDLELLKGEITQQV